MATLVKHQAEKKLPQRADNDMILLPAGKQQLLNLESRPGGGGSPKSVIRDHATCANSTYHYSCSSSSSAERATSANSQREGPVHLNAYRDKPKCKIPQQKECSVLGESNAEADPTDVASIDQSNTQSREGCYLSIEDMNFEFYPPCKKLAAPVSLRQPHSLISTSTQAGKPSKPHEAYVPKGFSLTSKSEDGNNLKSLYKQGAPIDNLINTLTTQYQPSAEPEDVKTFRHACHNVVLADACNGAFKSDLIKPKFISSKWDEDENWMCTNLSSTSTQTLHNSNHKVPLFRLSHYEHPLPVPSVDQDSFSMQSSCNKVREIQPFHVQTNPSMRDKDILKNEVEKLTSVVSCAQACLERIQPIPPPKNVATNPFLAQGVFQNRAYPMVAQSMLKPTSQVEPLITRSVFRSSHAPSMGPGGMEPFWGSPMKAGKQHPPSIDSHPPGIRAPKKEVLRPLTSHIGSIEPSTKDAECKKESPDLGEHLHVQKHELHGGQALTTTSYMKDAATEISPPGSHRDIGTQVTPVGSSRHPSAHCSPQKAKAMSPTKQHISMQTAPPISKAIIDMRKTNPLEVERCRLVKFELRGVSAQDQVQHSLGTSFDSNWSSREEEEADEGKGLRHLDLEDLKRDVLDARATAWKEATRLKLLAKYEREETKIQAWEDLQAAKAEADLSKLEMKLERKRIQMRTKIASRLHAAHKKAEGRRIAAKAYRQDAMEKTCHRADEMLEEANIFQAKYPLCACFSQSLG